jgi:uncharacterized protein
MEFVAGFLIALAIAITGVGGGVITAPVLMLFFRMAPAQAVGTSLLFAAFVKLLVVPVYLYRRLVNYRVLGLMLLGGLPGVLAGGLYLKHLHSTGRDGLLYLVLGGTIAATAAFNLYRSWSQTTERAVRERSLWLPAIMLPIGAEVGFSSAGAGALGTLALFSTTNLKAAEVVGTDVVFGLVLSLVGGGMQLSAGNYDGSMLLRLLGGGVLGALLGANLTALLPSRGLRVALSLWLMSLGIQLCWSTLAR